MSGTSYRNLPSVSSLTGTEVIGPLWNGLADSNAVLNLFKTFIQSGMASSASPIFSGPMQIGSRTFLTELNGDFWLTVNASWNTSTSQWNRVNTAQTAFAINFQSNDNIPGESNTKGIIIWRAVPGTNPIGSTFGAVGGWELAQAITEYKDWVCGGMGLELDGNGLFPYGRFIHSTADSGTTVWTGIVTNLFANLANVDDVTKPSWFIGRKNDQFVVARAPAGATTAAGLVTLLSIDSSGNITVAGTGLGGSGTSLITPNTITTTPYTFVLTDGNGKAVQMNLSAPNSIIIPLNSSVAFPVGQILEVCQFGLGQTTLSGASGTTIRGPASVTTLATKAQNCSLFARQQAANDWVIGGDYA